MMFHPHCCPALSPLRRIPHPLPHPPVKTSALAVCALIALTTSVFAQSLSWDTTGSNDSGDFGNALVFNDSGRELAITSWGHTRGDFDDAFEAARGSLYSIGMGVSNAEEGTGTNDHQMDNSGGDDWMLFYFDGPVEDVKIVVDPYGTWDRDVTYYTARLDGPVNLTGLSYSDLASLGFDSRRDSLGSVGSAARQVSIQNVSGGFNAILFGAWQGEPTADSIDRFKISSVSASPIDPVTVPEPSSALLGVIGGLALLRRRR